MAGAAGGESLDAAVRRLTRAALGASMAGVDDAALDAAAARLVRAEAAAAHARYSSLGASGLLPSADSSRPPPAPNTQFLARVIRSTGAHNAALLRGDRPAPPRSASPPPPERSGAASDSPSQGEQGTKPPSRVRGRGSVGPRSLDKMFQDGYDPRLDLDNYDAESSALYVARLEQLQRDKDKLRRDRRDGGAGRDGSDSDATAGSSRSARRRKSKHKSKKSSKKRKKHKSGESSRSGKRSRRKRSRRSGSDNSSTDSDSDASSASSRSARRRNSRSPAHSPAAVDASAEPKQRRLPAVCPW